MALVTRQFRDDLEAFIADRMARSDWSADDAAELREMVRADLQPGPDMQRAGLVVRVGLLEMPAAIDDQAERYRLWAEFFEAEAEAIRAGKRDAFGGRSNESTR